MPTLNPATTIETPKDGKFDFGSDFVKVTNLLLDTYQEAMNVLEKITKNPESEISDLYGVCNKTYKIRYITPSNIASYIDYLVKAICRAPEMNVGDLEMLSVELIRQFIHDNKECVPLEDTNVFPSGDYLRANSSMEQLVLACRNEYYDTAVYSKSDMINRAKAIGENVKLMDSIKFTLNVKRLITSIPDILNRNSGMSSKDNMLAEEFIKRFLQTAAMINLATVEQLIAYCIPRSSYNLTRVTNDPNKRLDYDFIGEAVDLNKYSPVFINLSYGADDLIHKAIRHFGDAVWSHSSISFDPHMGVMYTINGGVVTDDVYGKQTPGFHREALHSTKYNDVLVRVYVMFVPNEVVAKMKDTVANLETARVKYDYVAMLKKAFDPHAKAGDNPYKQICSSFVNAIIALAGKPLTNEEIASPEDLNTAAMVRPNQVFKLYEGPGKEYDYDAAMEKIKEIAAANNTIPYSEQFVTESCMLKTADMCIRGKLPFNCNVRDIVLLDMSSDYKDVTSAVKFIMGDSRSPIAALVRKYRTRDEYPLAGRILPMFMHIKPYPSAPADGKPKNKWEAGMHTDTGWLDKITYGDEFLDGNYRDDALGNNKFEPATQTLRALYDMFKCDDMKSNEELANNVYDVACAIMDIAGEFKPGMSETRTLENREMVRDILVVLAEIMTRSMLKLFYNNTICLSASDDMPDTMVPGYMYTEGFVMEAASPTPNQKVGVNVTDAKGNAVNRNIGQRIADLMRKFVQWLSTSFAKIVGKFSSDHKAEIDWVNKNMQLNTDIKNALANNTFNITLSGYVPYNVPVKALADGISFTTGIDSIISEIENGTIKDPKTINQSYIIGKVMTGEGLGDLKNALSSEQLDANAKAQAVENFVLFGTPGTQAIPTNPTKLTAQMWMDGEGTNAKGIVTDIIYAGPAIKAFVDKAVPDLKKAADTVATKAKENPVKKESTIFDILDPIFQEAGFEMPELDMSGGSAPAAAPAASPAPAAAPAPSQAPAANTSAQPTLKDAAAKMKNSYQEKQPENAEASAASAKPAMYQQLATEFPKVQAMIQTKAVNVMIRKFYANSYKIYRDIVTAYRSQANAPAQQPAQQTAAQTGAPAEQQASETQNAGQ